MGEVASDHRLEDQSVIPLTISITDRYRVICCI